MTRTETARQTTSNPSCRSGTWELHRLTRISTKLRTRRKSRHAKMPCFWLRSQRPLTELQGLSASTKCSSRPQLVLDAGKALVLWNTGSRNVLERSQHDYRDFRWRESVVGGSDRSTRKGGADVTAHPLGQQRQSTRPLSTTTTTTAAASPVRSYDAANDLACKLQRLIQSPILHLLPLLLLIILSFLVHCSLSADCIKASNY